MGRKIGLGAPALWSNAGKQLSSALRLLLKESEAGSRPGCPLGELGIADTMPACRSALISPSLASSRRDLPIEDALERVRQDKEGPKDISSSMVGWWR